MSTSPASPIPSATALRLLSEIVREAGDGYTLMSRSGLKGSQFEAAVGELLSRSLILVKGDTSGERLGESYFYVPLVAQGRADYLLGPSGATGPAKW